MTRSTTTRRANHAPLDLDVILAKCTDDAGCWLWNGAMHMGMPVVRYGGKVVNVRRYIAEHLQGQVVAGKYCTATCTRKSCCAPDHIAVVTRKALQRKTTKLTQHQKRTTRNEKLALAARAKAVLTPETVAEIRASDLPGRDLAAQYGVSLSAVQKARNHQSWRDYRSPFVGLVR